VIVVQGHRYAFGVEGSWAIPNSLIASGIRDRGFTDVTVRNLSDVSAAELPPVPANAQPGWDTVGWATRVAPTADEQLPDRVRWVVDLTPAPPPAPSPPSAPSTPSPKLSPSAQASRSPILSWMLQPAPTQQAPSPAGTSQGSALAPAQPLQQGPSWPSAVLALGLALGLVLLPYAGSLRGRLTARRAPRRRR